jgi:hypothetical protein
MNGRLLTPGVVIAGLEACWLYALLHLLHAKIGAAAPGAGILGFYALSYAYHAWIPWPRRRRLLRELTGWLLWAVLLFGWTAFAHAVQGGWAGPPLSRTLAVFAWPAGLLATAAAGGLWFMGRRLGSLGTDFALCLGEFQFGLAMLVTIYYADAQFGIPLEPLLPLTVLYFVLGLTGLSISREEVGTGHTDGAPQRGRFGPLAASLGIILLMAFWIFFVITPDLLARGLSVIVEIGRAFIRVLAWLIGFLASLFPAPDTGPIQTPPPMGSPKHGDALDLAHWLVMPESVRMVGRILVGAAWIILFLLPLWRISTDILQWLRKRAGFTQGSESEALKGAFREDLLRIIGAIREKFLALVRCFRPRAGRAALDFGTAGVRQAYRLLLGWAAAAECRRDATRTPDEYLVALEAWLPEARGEFAFITGQYVRARYGPGPVEEGTLRELDLCLRTVRRLRGKKGRRRIR